jgi:TRAP-type C4-dicarboxylate transport system substrate-binding protein
MTEWTQFNEPYAVLKTEIEKRSAGRIEVKLYPAGVLGDMTSSTDQVRRGIIQGAQVGDGWIANPFAEIQRIFIPYVFKDRDVAWYVLAVVTCGPTVNLWLPRSFGFAGS